ncbi:MAG: hypothetical protein E6501_07740, partial [Bradyrhizobium sp.]|nr:hypothetical protein [Bradyrhizobium sp.]
MSDRQLAMDCWIALRQADTAASLEKRPILAFMAARRAARDTKGVHLCGYVNDRQLRWLYRHARGFVLP